MFQRCQKSIDQSSNNNDFIKPRYNKNSNLLQKPPTVPIRSVERKIWDMLRQSNTEVTIYLVRQYIDVTYFKAKALLDSWVIAGYVKRGKVIHPNAQRPQYSYQLLLDCGQQPPQVNLKGQTVAMTSNELCWRAMRILKVFNAAQLLGNSETPDAPLKISTIKQYVRQLYMAGYLMMIEQAAGQLAVHRLMHDTGPREPEIRRGKKIYDGNLGMIVYDPEKPLPPSHQNIHEQDND